MGMEWFPECKDGGLDRYLYELLQALAQGSGTNGWSGRDEFMRGDRT